MANFDTARNVLETSANSTGSAMAEHEKWMQSLEAKTLKLEASWQSLSQTFLSSDFLKVCFDGVINLVDGLNSLIDTVGVLPTILGTVAAGLSIFNTKGFQGFISFNKNVDGTLNKLKFLGKTFTDIKRDVASGQGLFTSLFSKSITKADVGYITEYFNQVKSGIPVGKAYANTLSHASVAGKQMAVGIKNGTRSMGELKTATIGGKAALLGLKVAATAANIALTMGLSVAIQFVVDGIMKLINAKKDLAESVEEVISKFKEEHDELTKLKSDYDTSNESSMVSKYEKLSKGVDGLGRNVSLTADEYSEYQSIVNSIAEQIPSLVSGYDSQGNAILSCKGNVEELTKAYEKLIHAQNQEILSANASDIEKNWQNTVEQATGYDFLEKWGNIFSWDGMFGGTMDDYDMKTDTAKWLSGLTSKTSQKEIESYINDSLLASQEIRQALKNAGYDIGIWASDEKVSEVLKDALENEPEKIRGILDNYYNGFDAAVEEYKTKATALLSEAFDVSGKISGLNYENIGEELQNIAYQTVNSLDFDFLSELTESGKTIDQWTKEMLNQLNSISKSDNAEIVAAFDLKTQFNGGDISYGQYVKNLKDVEQTIDDLNLKSEAKEQLKISLGLDENGVIDQYESLLNRLTSEEYEIQMKTEEAKKFLDGLTASEYAVAVDLIMSGEVDLSEFDIGSLREYIEKEAKINEALNYTIAIDVETEGFEALNTAMAESVSGAGLSSESIATLKGRYAELESQGYDLSAMFEETSNGIHLNKKAVSELEQALASQKLAETNDKLGTLKTRYDELTVEIDNCTDASERASLYAEQQTIVQKINDLGTLAAQYKGLTSAYNAWQNAESAGQERDMYESIIEGFENIGDEISRGWYDDGTIKFLELITGQTGLAGRSATELKEIWNSLDDTIKGTSYSVRDFFTVNEDGDATSTGAYNFLKAVEELGNNGTLKALEGKNIDKLVERNSDGKIVAFDFSVVGGDKAVAEALGISEEMVQIIQRTLDDAGFVVTLDGKYTLLADLQTSAEEANDTLKKLQSEGLENLKDVDLDFNFNVDTIEGYQEQLKKATDVLDKFRDKNGKLKTDKNGNLVKGAQEALEIAQYYTAAMDKLTEPKFMQIDTSTVDAELKDPIEKMQKIGDLCKEKHQVVLTGDTEEIDEVQDKIDAVAKEIEDLEPEVKAQIGIDKNWTAEEIADKIEKGEIEIPASLELDVQMSDDLKDMRLMMMHELGLVDDNEVKLKVGYDIDDSVIDNLTEDEKEVVIKYIEENEDVWDDYTDGQKEAVVKIIADGTDIENWKAEDKEALVKYVADGGDVENWTPEQKQAWAHYLVDHGDIDGWSPEMKQAWAQYLVDGGDVEGWTPEMKEAYAKYIVDGGDVTGYMPEDKKALAKYLVDGGDPANYQPPSKTQKVKADLDSSEPDNYQPKDKKFTVKAVLQKVGDWWNSLLTGGSKRSVVNGTANVNGTFGRAFARGNWRTDKTEEALVGELGREIIVTPNNQWYTVGDSGAEFTNIPKGSIVFNHRQTEELLKNGKVTSSGGRGKAIVNGSAFAQGTAFSKGSGGGEEPEVTSIVVGTNKNTGKSYTKSTSTDSKNDFEETLDWIEVAISRIERAINNLDQKANNVYKSWSSRNKALVQEISEVGDEISLQEKAAKEYLAAANGVGLSESYASKVRSGRIDIETIKDETLKQKIDDYQKYYESYLDCIDAAEKLRETESKLYAQRFENVQSEYDGILQAYEHTESMLNEYISQAEERGYIVSKKYYQALIKNEKQSMAQLKKEQADLIAKRDEAVASGAITKNSEAWFEQCAAIDEVTQAIESSTTALLEFDNAMRDIDWSIFDLIQERISSVTSESDFLIDLMSNKDLFDDKGKLTSQGLATMGLHAQNANVYMYQADEYAKEIAKLNKQISKDPYDQELINRRNELLELQRESILNAEDEKEAIRDMVEEGINLELDSLSELIDKKNEALDSEKD